MHTLALFRSRQGLLTRFISNGCSMASFWLHNSLAAKNGWALRALTFKNPLWIWPYIGQPYKDKLTRVSG
jgi:hypothetical protein